VEVSKKPLRVVTQFTDGSFKQIRKTKHGNAGGREVIRGYPIRSATANLPRSPRESSPPPRPNTKPPSDGPESPRHSPRKPNSDD